MGMQQRILLPQGGPNWPQLRDLLARHNCPVQLRMIDGELAFPDEQPPENWRELRVSTAQGMATLQRQANVVTVVVWGDGDAGLRRLWNALTWACAVVGAGRIETSTGLSEPADYLVRAELPTDWRP